MSSTQDEMTTADTPYIINNIWEKSRPEWLLANENERQETLRFIQNHLKSK